MKVPAKEFPNTGLSRKRCDRCRGPIALCWKGRDGEYCCNECLEQGDRITMTTATEGAKTPASPIKVPEKKNDTAAAKPAAKKKTAAKATKKKAVAKGKAKVKVFEGDPKDAFRAGTTKGKLWAKIFAGDKVTKESLIAICDKDDNSRTLVWRVIRDAGLKGFNITVDKEHVHLVSKKPAKKAA